MKTLLIWYWSRDLYKSWRVKDIGILQKCSVERLSWLRDRRAIPHLLYAIHELHIPESADGLAAIGDPSVIPELYKALTHAPGNYPHVRYRSAEALATLGHPGIRALFQCVCNGKDGTSNAIRAIGNVPSTDSLPTLIECLDVVTREKIIQSEHVALIQSALDEYWPESQRYLYQAINHHSPRLQQYAREILSKLQKAHDPAELTKKAKEAARQAEVLNTICPFCRKQACEYRCTKCNALYCKNCESTNLPDAGSSYRSGGNTYTESHYCPNCGHCRTSHSRSFD